ncbi:MAG: HupE/UreJ family protein, partial [Myxococcota bacterium]|nr:HupE/UreJ family protein [Myxococcota bacterium]
MKETRRGGVALLLAAVLVPLAATAHRLAPSLLEVRETAPGRIAVFWKTPLQRPVGAAVEPELPAGCAVEAAEPGVDGTAATLRFEAACDVGLIGARFGVRGLAESRTEALLRLTLLDGRSYRAVLRGGDEAFVVPERQRALDVFVQYLGLG